MANLVKNDRNPGRTLWGVLGHEANVEQVDGRFIVVTRRRNAYRRSVKAFGTFEEATTYLTGWVASEQKGA